MISMNEHRVTLISDLLLRQMDHADEAVRDAVRALAESLLCDLKFDRDLFNETLMAYGWTPEDVEYFGISDLFLD